MKALIVITFTIRICVHIFNISESSRRCLPDKSFEILKKGTYTENAFAFENSKSVLGFKLAAE
jgi:hypothetical protein